MDEFGGRIIDTAKGRRISTYLPNRKYNDPESAKILYQARQREMRQAADLAVSLKQAGFGFNVKVVRLQWV